eukprot:scaffold738_cov340-Pavlova_lutheri.AAC.4
MAQDGMARVARGPTPENNPGSPSVRSTFLNVPHTVWVFGPLPLAGASWIRVLITSSGVVSVAATDPAIPPA